MTQPNLQPILKSDLITIRPIGPQDWEGMYMAASNPKVWSGHIMKNRYKKNVFRPYFNSAVTCGTAFSIIDNNNGRIIGTSRYHDHKPECGEIEIGWTFIDCNYWGGLYNAEVKRLMLEYAFTFVNTVVFWVAKDNIRSQKAMVKIGGTLRPGAFSKVEQGRNYTYIVFEITEGRFRNWFQKTPK